MATKLVKDIIKDFKTRHFFDTKSKEAFMVEAIQKVEHHYLEEIKRIQELLNRTWINDKVKWQRR